MEIIGLFRVHKVYIKCITVQCTIFENSDHCTKRQKISTYIIHNTGNTISCCTIIQFLACYNLQCTSTEIAMYGLKVFFLNIQCVLYYARCTRIQKILMYGVLCTVYKDAENINVRLIIYGVQRYRKH